jgi:hypothetical protein
MSMPEAAATTSDEPHDGSSCTDLSDVSIPLASVGGREDLNLFPDGRCRSAQVRSNGLVRWRVEINEHGIARRSRTMLFEEYPAA